MNYKKEMQVVEDMMVQMKNLLRSKGNDYSDEDRLSSFKMAANICGISPQLVCLVFIATKVSRAAQLVKGKIPNHESLNDTIIDGANYFVLLKCIEEDSREAKDYQLEIVFDG